CRGHRRPPDCPWATRRLPWRPGPGWFPAARPGSPALSKIAACNTPFGTARLALPVWHCWDRGAIGAPAPGAAAASLIAEAQAEGITAAYVAIDVVESVNISRIAVEKIVHGAIKVPGATGALEVVAHPEIGE